MTEIDERLKEWASARQIEYIDAVNKTGSYRAAAKQLGVADDTVRASLVALQRRATLQGFSPDHGMVRPVPNPFVIKGISTLRDRHGDVVAEWTKTKLDDRLADEAIREFVTWLAQDARGMSPLIPLTSFPNNDLLVIYPMGDPHFGMYAWAAEAGDNFDLNIAEKITRTAADRLISSSPASDIGIILNLGDFFHADNQSNRTERSGNALDVDGRWSKVMQVGLRTMIYCVTRALERHNKVIVRNVKGNHDTHSSFALSLALDAFFSNNPRVQVELSPSAHWYFRWHKILIGATHGDTTKPNDLPAVMACDVARDWGETEYRYWLHGHIHNKQTKEYPGCLVESFNTLAAKDAWHAAEGYRSRRNMQSIVYHKDYGEIERHTCDIQLVEALQKAS